MRMCAMRESRLAERGSSRGGDVHHDLEICKRLRHPNIVSCLGYELAGPHLCVFFELCAGGSMSSVLAEFGPLSAACLKKAAYGALAGLEYLHTRSPPIMHGDIKGASLLLDLHHNAKLADFCCTRCGMDTTSFEALGSIPWMAPEVINCRGRHGYEADVWSFGCLMIEMATAEKPWGNHAFENVTFAVSHIGNSGLTPPIPDHLPSRCEDFIHVCTRREPPLRPSTTELLGHEYVVHEARNVMRIPEASRSAWSPGGAVRVSQG